jgi:hypothetical protein
LKTKTELAKLAVQREEEKRRRELAMEEEQKEVERKKRLAAEQITDSRPTKLAKHTVAESEESDEATETSECENVEEAVLIEQRKERERRYFERLYVSLEMPWLYSLLGTKRLASESLLLRAMNCI